MTTVRQFYSGIHLLHLVCSFCFSACALLLPLTVQAQVIGGKNVFEFMTLSPSARITALGGMQVSVQDDDVSFAATNPAALNPSMDGRLVFNHNFFLSDIQHGYVAFAKNLPKIDFTVHGGLQYINYGDIPQADEFGVIQGKVKAAETAFTLGAARQLSPRFTLGMNLRFGVSTLDVYQASALVADVGIMYSDTTHRFSAGLVMRNYGTQIARYNDIRENLPNDIQLGFSKRLRYLPFRLSVIIHHLQQWNIRYDDPALQTDQTLLFGGGQSQSKGNPGLDNFFQHFVFNGEFLLGHNELFRIRLGYNHLRKKELSVTNYRSLAGFSGGVGIRIYRFRIDVGYAAYHLAGGVLHLGIGTNLKDFF